MRFRRISAGIALALAALAVGACGGEEESESGGSGGGGGATTLAIAAPEDGSLKFTESSWNAKAGQVKVDFDNPSSVPHAVEIEGNGVEKETKTVTEGKASVTVDLKPGTYTVYCPVGNHEQAGMKGELTVE
jgi:plastocyanin